MSAPSTVPDTPREELVEVLHGHRVADPYRWLEAPAHDPRVRAFVARQSAASEAVLGALPAREAFRAHLRRLWDHPRRAAPWRRGGHWFQLRNDGRDQDVLWGAPDRAGAATRAPDEQDWRVLVDPNTWTQDGTAALHAAVPNDDGTLVAYARADAGSDWLTWHVLDVRSGEVLPDRVPWGKVSNAAWLPDGSGFVHGGFDPPPAGQEHADANRGHRLRLHRLGTDAADDELVHADPDDPELVFDAVVSHDGRWLLVEAWRGTSPDSRVLAAPVDGGEVGEVRPLLDRADARYEVLGVVGDELLLVTDLDAPLGRVVAVDLRRPGPPREVLGERDEPLLDARLVGGAGDDEPGWIVCRRLHHATGRLEVHDLDGRHRVDVVPPGGPATITEVTGGRHDRAVHLAVETFTRPATVLRTDLADGATTVVTPGAAPDDGHLVVEQVRVHHDGVAIPLFLVHRRDVAPDGQVPTVLWGYGGFGIPVTPSYRPAWRTWVDAGGLLAVACLRGGGEYGRAWHDAGRLANKPHVFDDALACAAWLTGRRRGAVTAEVLVGDTAADAVWTAPDRLGIEGRSNGGLLVGACITREPEAFGSAVAEVGVLDLVRFHRFTIGWAWTSDFGSPDDPDDLATLLGYSPYHRVAHGRPYPATLLTTGDTDDRVVPAHSYKFAAALQAAGGRGPVLLRVDTSAGHGAGKPVGKLVDERADVLAFHAEQLGLVPDLPAEAG